MFDKCFTPFPDGFLGCLASSSSFGFARKLAAGFICKRRRGGLIRPTPNPVFISFHFCLLSPTALLSFLHSHSKTIAAPIRLTPRSSGTGRLTGDGPAFQFPLLSFLWIGWNPRGICRCCRQLVKRLKCYNSHEESVSVRRPLSFWFCFSGTRQ